LPGDPAKLYNDAYSISNDTASTAETTAASSTSGPIIPQPKDHIPFTTAIINLRHGTSHPLVVLLDSGSGLTWGHPSILPKGCNPKTVDKLSGDALAGTFCSNQQVTAETMCLPEFFKQRALSDVPIRMMNAPCRYDIIIGRDALTRFGMKLDLEDLTMTWDGKVVPMRVPSDYPTKPGETSPLGMNLYIDAFEDELFDNDKIHFVSDDPMPQDGSSHDISSDSFANPNLTLTSNKYKAVHINDWVESNCKHLDSSKRQALAEVLIKYPSLWDNKLGTYPDNKVHLELSDDDIPHSSRGYPVPFAHCKLFKEELDPLVSIGVLEPCGRSEWCAGTFIVGKASGGCRWLQTSVASTSTSSAEHTLFPRSRTCYKIFKAMNG